MSFIQLNASVQHAPPHKLNHIRNPAHTRTCREVVLLKRSLADARKQEAERIEAALRDQKRKIARRQARQPSLLDKFLQTK